MFTKTPGDQMREERKALLKDAQAIITKAQDENRDITKAEQDSIEAKFGRVDEIDKKFEQERTSKRIMDQISGLGSSFAFDGEGTMFDAEQAKGLLTSVRTKTSYATTVRTKSLAMLMGHLAPASVSQEIAHAPMPTTTVELRELFRLETAQSATVRYYVASGGHAEVVPEGGLKPDAGIKIESKDAELLKIATRLKLSDELAEDGPALLEQIGTRAVLSVLAEENAQIVKALTETSGALVQTGTTAAPLDAIAAAIGSSEAYNGVSPSAVVLNPADLAVLRQLKASGGGHYIIDPTTSGPSSVFGVRFAATSAVPAGTMFMVTNGLGVFYTRGDLRLESGHSGEDFDYNLFTIRAEERVLPTVTLPSYVTKITLTN